MHITRMLAIFLSITSVSVYTKTPISAYIGALPIIWTAHYTGEAISTTIHELGHALTKNLQDGDPINITVKHTPAAKKNLIALICTPFHGYAEYEKPSTSYIKNIGHGIAGPLAGLAATYAQLIGLELIKQSIHNEQISYKKALKNGLSQPFTLLKNIATCSAIERPSLTSYIIQGITLFRCSRLIGETLYGLTPFNMPGTEGDGVKLWRDIMQKQDIKTIGQHAGDIVLYTAAPFIIAALIASTRMLTKRPIHP